MRSQIHQGCQSGAHRGNTGPHQILLHRCVFVPFRGSVTSFFILMAASRDKGKEKFHVFNKGSETLNYFNFVQLDFISDQRATLTLTLNPVGCGEDNSVYI